MAESLKLARNLELPIDAVTQSIAVLGRKGSGKSYGSSKLAELMLDIGAQIVVLDVVGVWWGLRVNAAKTGPSGYDIPVLGGLHGDIPLEPGAGALIADLVVDRGISVVLDVSQFESDAEKARFAEAFGSRFFFRKKQRPSAVHVFLEECQEFVPQNPQRGEERMLHAYTRMMKLGRNFGIGMSLISQRPQEVNKKVLNMCELLLAFQATGIQEREVIEKWAVDRGVDEDPKSLSKRLPFLEVGTAHAWSPQWLQIGEDVHILKKKTADVSSTPKVGEAAVEAKPLGAIDLAQLQDSMAATIEKAKAEDPAELRKQLAERDRALAQLRKEKGAADPDAIARARHQGRVDAMHDLKKVVGPQLRRVDAHIDRLSKGVDELVTLRGDVRMGFDALETLLTPNDSASSVPPSPAPRKPERASGATVPAVRTETPARSPRPRVERELVATDGKLGGSKRKILEAIAFYNAAGTDAPTKSQVAGYAGIAVKATTTLRNALSELRVRGLIEDVAGERLELTPAGRDLAGDVRGPNSLQELHDRRKKGLSASAVRVLDVLLRYYPSPIGKAAAAAEANVSAETTTLRNALSELRTRELLVDHPDDEISASPLLFPEGLS